MKLCVTFGQSVLAAGIVAIAACNSTTMTTTPSPVRVAAEPDGGKDAGSSGSSNSTSSSSSSGEDAGISEPVHVCEAESSQSACIECCRKDHKEGYSVYTSALIACLCKVDVCAVECASSYCASPPRNPDPTCAACAQGGGLDTCQSDLSDACLSDPGCAALNSCFNAAKCESKK